MRVKRPRKAQQLRIIGGTWRGRKLRFPEIETLRPTPDRVRETLFNWLAPIIAGAYCLDLYAGSGALGFEALSRGASGVVMVDSDARAVARLREHAHILHTSSAEIIQADMLTYLAAPPPRAFDIVFLDPPFRQGLIAPACEALEKHGWLKPGATVYLEAEADYAPQLPDSWRIIKSKQAGQVGYHLARCGER
ncbi:MAG: 16S rRNA (guanine(966)-N(2))-methyltransferase RsmD [Gammaproteobacteria bacterium]|nr:16S rRNA (guanine(966)-N(2))-methyltransferase RsmD [Gammaproteobacteria bacterium]